MSHSSEQMGGEALFSPGELVTHKLFGYRGVVVDVDATFQLTDEWYEGMARSRPPRDHPWYHVLVDQAEHMTYVAQRNLEADPSGEPIRHPMLERFFNRFDNGRYLKGERAN
jgi:heat shock protein HspQ